MTEPQARPTLRKLPLAELKPRPGHPYRMSNRVRRSLLEQITRTGLYPPLIVRPLGGGWEILDGHQRADVLRELGVATARCDVWPVGDDQAEEYAATLNHLRGHAQARDRARSIRGLVRRLGRRRVIELLGMTPAGIRQQFFLLRPPPALSVSGGLDLEPVTFHLPAGAARRLDASLRHLGDGPAGKADALLAAVRAAEARHSARRIFRSGRTCGPYRGE